MEPGPARWHTTSGKKGRLESQQRVGKLRSEKPQSRWEAWKLVAPSLSGAEGAAGEELGSGATSPGGHPSTCLPPSPPDGDP